MRLRHLKISFRASPFESGCGEPGAQIPFRETGIGSRRAPPPPEERLPAAPGEPQPAYFSPPRGERPLRGPLTEAAGLPVHADRRLASGRRWSP
ncbi:hypothetical protein MTO96_017219 [Rhipicephalus appendiculatus]